jgi:PPK2 family polyphosphate:nucleotide phosphotransferase
MGKKKSAHQQAEVTTSYVTPFRFDGSGEFQLKSQKTDEKADLNKDAGREILDHNSKRLGKLQQMLYAENRWSVLLIFQGMDAAGKDSAIEHVMSGINPQGCQVVSFKTPSSKELDHDFMWRSLIALPERGRIGIFNRSYYEECLIVRVHREILAKEKLPAKLVTKTLWRERFEDISAIERYLARNGTIILKFFLNVSKEEQRKRFMKRLEDPAKNWKFEMGDVAERALWDKYQAAYQDVIRNTSSTAAPWFVVPADHKWFSRVVISSAIVNALEGLDLQFPKTERHLLPELRKVRIALEKEKAAEGNGEASSGEQKSKSKAKDQSASEQPAFGDASADPRDSQEG